MTHPTGDALKASAAQVTDQLLARVASIICEETCGLTSQCKSREAAKALFEKGYLASTKSIRTVAPAEVYQIIKGTVIDKENVSFWCRKIASDLSAAALSVEQSQAFGLVRELLQALCGELRTNRGEHQDLINRARAALSPVEQAPQPVDDATGLQYRPNEFDDWGVIRDVDGNVFASVRRPAWEEELAEHRRNGTDPYEDLARRLISTFSVPTEAPPVESQAAGFAEWLNSGPEIAKAAGFEVEIVAITSEGGTLKLTSSDFEARAALAAEGSAE